MSRSWAAEKRWKESEEKEKLISLGAVFLSNRIAQRADQSAVRDFLYKKYFDDSMISEAKERSQLYIAFDLSAEKITTPPPSQPKKS